MILSSMIVKEWFKNLIGGIVILFLLITTADLINGLLQGKDISRVFLEYGLKMPDLIGKMLPICCLVASLFSINHFKAHSELISMLAAGFSYIRFYALIGACALSVVLLQFINLGYLEPYANKIKRQEIQKSKASEGRYLTRSSIEGGKFWYKSKGYFASFTYFDRKTLKLKDLEIYYFSSSNKTDRILRSKGATFTKDKWVMKGVSELSSLENQTFPVVTSYPSLEVDIQEKPEDFGEFEADLTTLSYFNLYLFVSRLSKTGINISEYEIILLNKVFLSFVCLVFALFPLSSIFNPNRRSSSFGMSVVQTLVVTVVFWVLYSSSIAFGNSGRFSPIVATGLIPISLLCYVIWTFLKNRKLSI